MKSNYKIGEIVEEIDIRNTENDVKVLLGLSINKHFIKSVANTIGTDLKKYKVIFKDDFAVSLMQVSRDDKIPIACLQEYNKAIVSPAYHIFRIKNKNVICPEYLEILFRRSEFDREAAYIAVGGVRGSMPWSEFCRINLSIPSIEKQLEIVHQYKVISDRIALKQKINENLISTIKIMYKKFFSSENSSRMKLKDLCSKIGSGATPKGGKDVYTDKGISLIRSMNVFDFLFSYDNLAHINSSQAEILSNVIVEPYDVLFNITGVSIARCCIVPYNVLPARVNQHVMILRPLAGKYMSLYIMCTLCDYDNKLKLFGIGQSGSTRDAINKQEMESFEITLPDLEKINQFGKLVDKIFNKICLNENEILKLQMVLNLILSRLKR